MGVWLGSMPVADVAFTFLIKTMTYEIGILKVRYIVLPAPSLGDFMESP
jgi:hypothetical protein